MKNYTSKSDKVEIYSTKYDLSKEEVNRILSEHEDLLTLEELKIKYDDPNIGILPEWLTEEDLSNMIWKTIHQCWSPLFEAKTTKEDMYQEHQIYIRKKIKQYENHNHIKGSLVNRMLTLSSEYERKGKYFLGSVDEPIKSSSDGAIIKYKYEPSVSDSTTIEDELFLEKVRSIKDKSIKNLLIITGYLVCNIDGLRKDYIELLRTVDIDIRDNILNLENIILANDVIDQNRLEKIANTNKKVKIGVKDIIKALKLTIFDKEESMNRTLKEVRYYLTAHNLA